MDNLESIRANYYNRIEFMAEGLANPANLLYAMFDYDFNKTALIMEQMSALHISGEAICLLVLGKCSGDLDAVIDKLGDFLWLVVNEENSKKNRNDENKEEVKPGFTVCGDNISGSSDKKNWLITENPRVDLVQTKKGKVKDLTKSKICV